MKWAEFKSYLVALTPETPLGKIIGIRAENDKDVLKYFTSSQHRIRNEWRKRLCKTQSAHEQMDTVLEQIKQAFLSMAGGVSD